MSASWTVEAVKPVRFKYEGRVVCLRPGERVTLPLEKARELLWLGKGMVRSADRADWLELWQEVAAVSSGLEPDDPRLHRVLDVIHHLDACFVKGDFEAFEQGMVQLRQAMRHGGKGEDRGKGFSINRPIRPIGKK